MKKNLLCFFLLALAAGAMAQTNLSGTYGYSFKPQGNPPREAVNSGPSGKLVLLKMEGNKYRFWLDVTVGWPSYNVGETDGTLTIINDTASFDNTFEDATRPCILKFQLKNSVFHINSMSTSFNCGFGNGVNADGDYAWLKNQPVLNNQWLKKEYPEAPTVAVTDDKVELFQDESLARPFSPRQYFQKGFATLGIVQTEKTVYTEYIGTAGKLTWGWMKKSAVKITKSE